MHVVQGWPHRVWMIGLHLSMLGEVTDHGVSSGPACNAFHNLLALPSIKVCVQLLSPLLGLVIEGLVGWLLFLRRQLARLLGGCVFLGAGLVPLPLGGLDLLLLIGLCIGLLVCAEDVAYTREGVLDWRAVLTLIALEATWPSLRTSASPLQASTYSSSWGVSFPTWEGSNSLLVSWLLLVA